jgi:hypothetical protein
VRIASLPSASAARDLRHVRGERVGIHDGKDDEVRLGTQTSDPWNAIVTQLFEHVEQREGPDDLDTVHERRQEHDGPARRADVESNEWPPLDRRPNDRFGSASG